MNFTRQILSIIEEHSGINTGSAHTAFVESYAKKRLKELSASETDYLYMLRQDPGELRKLINSATINETYFFREEDQFTFLAKKLHEAEKNTQIKIWSAACSTGQEPVSIYALCRNLGINAKIYASDIDTSALEKFKSGVFSSNSFRNDGAKYKKLLEPLGNYTHDGFSIKKEYLKQIEIFSHNLAKTDEQKFAPEYFDIIFIRNVFIYFTPELRHEILKNMTSMLKPDGLLFISVNEIPSVKINGKLSEHLKKEHEERVYYFKKTEKTEKTEKPESVKKLTPCSGSSEKLQPQQSSQPSQQQWLVKAKIEAYSKDFFESLNSGKYEETQEFLDNWPFGLTDRELLFYFRGLLQRNRNSIQQARDNFYKATILNPEFWPALFQTALLTKADGHRAEAAELFKNCAKVIKKYVEGNNLCYNQIIEDFTPEYILELCRNMQDG